MRKFLTAFPMSLLALLLACSSEPSKPAAPPAAAKPPAQPTLYTGREAITKMYIAARNWAPDAKPFRLESQPTKEANGQDGKSGIWRASFASANRRALKTFAWSGIKSDDAPEPGISFSTEDSYNPSNASTQIFDIAFLKTDSDAALKAAEPHGGDKLLKKEPASNLNFSVDWSHAENKLIWHVLYGPSKNEPRLKIAVDASTGEFLRVEK
ncbi:MAG TPA: hypothetical protein VK473_07155 [Terriglobales bacterium]|nr:hypothetical protein [Terriglobales bacterium]